MKTTIVFKKLSDSKKEVLFSELYTLLSSGLDFSRSFKLLIDSEKDNYNAKLLTYIYTSIIQGEQLYMAIHKSKAFSSIDSGVLRIGEETGKIDETLLFLCNYYRKNEERRKMIKSAISYPIIILITVILVVTFMILVIVPMFEQVYMRMGGELPSITKFIIQFSREFPSLLMLSSSVLVLFGTWVYFTRDTERTQKNISGFILKIPYVGDIVKKNILITTCKLLALLLESGVPLVDGIVLLKEIINFYPYRISFKHIAKDLEGGESFLIALAKYPQLYNRKFITLIGVGEETNQLFHMLQKVGDELTTELEYKFKFIGNIIEPVLILLVGALVALILVSMYLPMFKLSGIMA